MNMVTVLATGILSVEPIKIFITGYTSAPAGSVTQRRHGLKINACEKETLVVSVMNALRASEERGLVESGIVVFFLTACQIFLL